ncbi:MULTISPECIES: transketolase family protein [unclassified Marinitoga]|uniref:transketolase family protein n=1 Tax=unclassified Marinitoga TaxID=2640159 RepID=UPI0006411FB6|nr:MULTISPECIES: transketolase family protein [unclassified Marinitoga]KLO24604.1 transketolase [Marinitoga sp. 1155]NUU98869.1 transketolase [Marinitoga sp. 1154]
MDIKILNNRKTDTKMMRDAYIDKLIELARNDERIVILDADLMNSNGTLKFLNAFPERAFNIGVQESNMVGIAAGLAATNKIPFAHTFTSFMSRRALDQVYMSVAYARLNVKLVATDPGITAAYNGGTHMALQDFAVMLSIPTMYVVEPTDCVMMGNLIEQITYTEAPFYIRLLRKFPTKIYEEGSKFKLGKGVLLLDGSDATIISSGIMVEESLKAAEQLKKESINVRVIDMFTLKPIDKELIIESAKKTGAIVTAENHTVINGLGMSVSKIVSENYPVPMEMVGINDEFGEVGDVEYLKKRFNLTAQDIVQNVKKVISRK